MSTEDRNREIARTVADVCEIMFTAPVHTGHPPTWPFDRSDYPAEWDRKNAR